MVHNEPTEDKERRVDMAESLRDLCHEVKVDRDEYKRQLHEMQMEVARAATAAASVTANGNGKKALTQMIGIPGAILAICSLLVLYHNSFAMPAIRTAAREAVETMLRDPAFWSSVKEVAAQVTNASVNTNNTYRDRQLDTVIRRVEKLEATVEENTRYLDSTGRRKARPAAEP